MDYRHNIDNDYKNTSTYPLDSHHIEVSSPVSSLFNNHQQITKPFFTNEYENTRQTKVL